MDQRREQAWHAMTVDGVLAGLRTTTDGLSLTEVRHRRASVGTNELPVTEANGRFRILLRQFVDPLILILIGAAVISVILESFVDAAIIGGAVLINATIGFFQERKVSVILEQLRGHLRHGATVIRGGSAYVIDARELVPGDIIRLQQGERVPADARLISVSALRTNEASLTGESMPVKKAARPVAEDAVVGDRASMVFMGTLVEEGAAKAVVVGTGARTQLGAIAKLIVRERRRDVTPLQERLRSLARILGGVFLAISLLLFGVGVATGQDPLQMFLTAAAVAVAAVPESLPVSLGIVLAIGARRILRRGGLIRKMAAAEALGSVTVIATDKTATLTEGNLTVERLVEADGRESFDDQFKPALTGSGDTILRGVLERLALATNAFVQDPSDEPERWQLAGNAFDKAILRTVLRAGIDTDAHARHHPRVAELPFSAKNRCSAVLNDGPDGTSLTVLGAPEIILGRSRDVDGLRDRMLWRTGELAARGLRVLAMASRPLRLEADEELAMRHVADMTFVALIVFSDPIRQDVRDVIGTAQRAGTRVIMVTGDHAQTAAYVGEQLGILSGPGRMIEGKDLPVDPSVVTEQYDVYARVTPEDKVRIVDALKAQGYHVAMLGDGVNDAPSLLRADIGVAVGSGTEVAKDASDLVLLDDSFRIIVAAIRQGRIIFDNIMKVTVFLLSDAFTEIVLVAGSILMGLPLPLLPAQILWVNIIEDVLPAIALAWDRGDGDVMAQRPRNIKALFSGNVRKLILMFTVITDLALFALFVWLLQTTGDVAHARTMTFVALGATSLAYVFSVRALDRPVWRTNPFSNAFLNVAVLIGIGLYAVAIYVPPVRELLGAVVLTGQEWGMVAGLALLNIAVFEAAKRVFLGDRTRRA